MDLCMYKLYTCVTYVDAGWSVHRIAKQTNHNVSKHVKLWASLNSPRRKLFFNSQCLYVCMYIYWLYIHLFTDNAALTVATLSYQRKWSLLPVIYRLIAYDVVPRRDFFYT